MVIFVLSFSFIFVVNFYAPQYQVPNSEDGQGEEIHEKARRADRVDRHEIRRSADRSGLPIDSTCSKNCKYYKIIYDGSG